MDSNPGSKDFESCVLPLCYQSTTSIYKSCCHIVSVLVQVALIQALDLRILIPMFDHCAMGSQLEFTEVVCSPLVPVVAIPNLA